jgi:hypothetical protein
MTYLDVDNLKIQNNNLWLLLKNTDYNNANSAMCIYNLCDYIIKCYDKGDDKIIFDFNRHNETRKNKKT